MEPENIGVKYENFILCNFCVEVLFFLGFLGDVNNPLVEYKKKKIKIDKNKIQIRSKKRNNL